MRTITVINCVLLLALTSCDQLSARQQIQKGTSSFTAQEYKDAVGHFEKALALSDSTDVQLVARINAAVAYEELRKQVGVGRTPSDDPAEQQRRYDIDQRKRVDYLKKEIAHLEAWSKSMGERDQHCLGEPPSQAEKEKALEEGKELAQVCVTASEGRSWLARLWEELGTRFDEPYLTEAEANASIDKAIGFWQKEVERNPDNTEALYNVAMFLQEKNDYPASLRVMAKQALASKSLEARQEIYEAIVWLVNSRWRELPWQESRELIDTGIWILQGAFKDDPQSPVLANQLNQLYFFRSLTAGSAWAESVDVGVRRHYQMLEEKLQEAEDAKSDDPDKSASSQRTTDGKEKSS